MKFPVDAPLDRVICALERLGFAEVRRGNHISLLRRNQDGTQTPITIPCHRTLKGSTLRTTLTLARVSRDEFIAAYEAC